MALLSSGYAAVGTERDCLPSQYRARFCIVVHIAEVIVDIRCCFLQNQLALRKRARRTDERLCKQV